MLLASLTARVPARDARPRYRPLWTVIGYGSGNGGELHWLPATMINGARSSGRSVPPTAAWTLQ